MTERRDRSISPPERPAPGSTHPTEHASGPWPGRLTELASRRPWPALCAAAAALVLGVVMPRGPMTTGDALASMAVGGTVGAVAGFLTRSRWAMLVAPVAFVVIFELVRVGETGPTVDGIRLGSIYGIAAFVTGRLVQGVLTLLPMAVGVAYGVAAARRWGAGRADAPRDA
jgi:proline iminopeptidase